MILYLIGTGNTVLAEVYVYRSEYVERMGKHRLWVAKRGRVG